MAIARVASNTWLTATATATSVAKAFGVNVTAGSLLVAGAMIGANQTITFGDDVNGSWGATPITRYDANFPVRVCLGFFPNAAAGATTITATATGSGAMGIMICELTGAATASPTDGTPTSSQVDGSGHTPDAGSIVTSDSGITIALSAVYNVYPPTAGTGYTRQTSLTTGTGENHLQDQIWSGAGTRSVAWATTESYSNNVAIAFKQAAAGGAVTARRLMMMGAGA